MTSDLQIVRFLETEFEIAVSSLSRLPGENENYLVSTDGGRRCVLKLTEEEFPEELAALEESAASAIENGRASLAVPRLLRTKENRRVARMEGPEDAVRFGRLLRFVEGQPWSELSPASPELLHDAGRAVGHVSSAIRSITTPASRRTHMWDLTAADRHRDKVGLIGDPKSRTDLEEAFRLWAGARPYLSGLEHGLIHGDLNDENLLVGRDDGEENLHLVGVLDFGDALYNPLINELAIAMAYLLLDQTDPWDAGAHLVRGRDESIKLAAEEVELLYPLVCGRLATTLAIAAERRRIDPTRASWFATEERAWTALRQYLEVSPAEAASRWAARIDAVPFAAQGAPRESLLEQRQGRFSGALSLSFRNPVRFDRGRGSFLFDEQAYPYFDLYNNVCHVGHCHPHVVEAGQRQMARLNTNSRYLYDHLSRYAERLCATLPAELSYCFFVNSGSEANELALRLARTHTGHRDVIVLDNAYHGHTQGLIDISPYKFNGKGGAGKPEWVHIAPMPDGYRGPHKGQGWDAGAAYGEVVGKIVSAMERPPAAFIAESLPSVGGQIVPPEGYFERAHVHVRAAGGVCILDEVQVGFARVGTHFWGFEQQGVVPDIVVMGKPIGNGHPLGAVVTTQAIAQSFADNGMEYFSTFGGNPVSCAIGQAVLDVVENEGLQEHALEVGTYLRDGLCELMNRHSLIGDVRGTGLFIGVELVRDRETLEPAAEEAAELVEELRLRRILTGTDGPHENVVKIKPPMVLTKADAGSSIREFDRILAGMGRTHPRSPS